EKRVSAHSIISCGVFSSNSSESLFIFCSDNMRALYRYNHCVNSDIAKQLINLNHKFYDQFGDSFSATRGRLQNGVIKILETIKEDESVLDLGCGNGLFLHTLSKRGHKSRLFGVDFSLPLLRDAESVGEIEFREVDLVRLSDFAHPF